MIERRKRLNRLKRWFPSESQEFYDCAMVLWGAMKDGANKCNNVAGIPNPGKYIENFKTNKVFVGNKVFLPPPVDHISLLIGVAVGLGLISRFRNAGRCNPRDVRARRRAGIV